MPLYALVAAMLGASWNTIGLSLQREDQSTAASTGGGVYFDSAEPNDELLIFVAVGTK
jgi:hypothetical protein